MGYIVNGLQGQVQIKIAKTNVTCVARHEVLSHSFHFLFKNNLGKISFIGIFFFPEKKFVF
jgi:hypothetical protein